jgi:electron transport complex protein RnfG
MKDMIKMVAALVLFATAACVGLAFVYEGTKTAIEERQKADLQAALKELFPEADSFEDSTAAFTKAAGTAKNGIRFEAAYTAKRGGTLAGAAIRAVVGGFNDDITVLAGIAPNGTISGIKILTITDTPGLGANAASTNYFVNKPERITFFGQFKGMSAKDGIAVEKDGGRVIAITAATITSRAISNLAAEAAAQGAAFLVGR